MANSDLKISREDMKISVSLLVQSERFRICEVATIFELLFENPSSISYMNSMDTELFSVILENLGMLNYVKEMNYSVRILPFDFRRIHPIFYLIVNKGEFIMESSFDSESEISFYDITSPEKVFTEKLDSEILEQYNKKLAIMQDRLLFLASKQVSDNNHQEKYLKRFDNTIVSAYVKCYAPLQINDKGPIYNSTVNRSISSKETEALLNVPESALIKIHSSPSRGARNFFDLLPQTSELKREIDTSAPSIQTLESLMGLSQMMYRSYMSDEKIQTKTFVERRNVNKDPKLGKETRKSITSAPKKKK